MQDEEQVASLYRKLLSRWNGRDAEGFAALFDARGSMVGFDGSCIESPATIAQHLASIFADHEPATYVSKVREIRVLGADTALLRSVVGMVPPGNSEIEPEVNAVQVLLVVRRADEWCVAHFQNTPARFDGRPEAAAALTEELRAVLAGEA